MPRSPARLIVAALAAVFFATPMALRAVGVTAHPFENRALAGPPRLSQGFGVFPQTTRFLIDRMPLREQAVHANTWISRQVFGTTPRYGQGALAGRDRALPFGAPQGQDRVLTRPRPGGQAAAPTDRALVGRGGWLYLEGELNRACYPFLPFAVALARWEQLVSIVRASGRRAVLLVVPDKSSVYPEHLPAAFPEKGCAQANRADMWPRLEQATSRRVVSLRSRLLAERRRMPDLLYYRTDSHWNSVGALVLVRETLARVGRGVGIAPGEVTNPGPGPWAGDLSTLLGNHETEVAPRRAIQRAPNAPQVRGRTLIVRDSFGDQPMPMLRPYFRQLNELEWFDTAPPVFVDSIAAADTVIFETVEREFTFRANAPGLASPDVLSLLQSRLRSQRKR